MEIQKDHRDVLRTLRNALVEFFIAFARLVFFWLPGGDATYGKALMAFHPVFFILVTAFFFIVPPKHPARLFILLSTLIIVPSQWLLGGCVVTRAEQRLTGEKITIMDPFLMLANIAVNRDTRNAATVSISTALLGIFFWCNVCDFIIP